MSKYTYDIGRRLTREDPPFEAIIQAAMRKADGPNLATLQNAFPHIYREYRERYQAPGGFLPGDFEVSEQIVVYPEGVDVDDLSEDDERVRYGYIHSLRYDMGFALVFFWKQGELGALETPAKVQTISLDRIVRCNLVEDALVALAQAQILAGKAS